MSAGDEREAILPLIPLPPTKDTPRPRGGLLLGPVAHLLWEPNPPPNVLPPLILRIKAGKSPIYFLS